MSYSWQCRKCGSHAENDAPYWVLLFGKEHRCSGKAAAKAEARRPVLTVVRLAGHRRVRSAVSQ